MKKKLLLFAVTAILALSSLCAFTSCANGEKSISTYDINITLEENKVKGCEIVTFYNHTDNAFAELKFNLFANAFRKDAKFAPISQGYTQQAYYNGESYGKITIEKVYYQDKPLEFIVGGADQNVLTVKLLEEVFPNQRVTVKIDYTVELAEVIARTGVNQKTINLANFYPILCGIQDNAFYECVYYANGDPYFADCADYKVTITADKDYVIASSGKLLEETKADKTKTSVYSLENCRNFAFVMSKEFKVLTDTSLGVNVNYYYYDDQNAEASMQTIIKSLSYFNGVYGSYVYGDYSVCQTKFVQGGMEFSGLVMISDSLEAPAYNEVIVHETAHQWWMSAVGNNEIEYSFLDESLAEYSVVLFYENHPEYGFNREVLIASSRKTYAQFCTIYDRLYHNVDTTMIRPIDKYSSEYEYVNIAYVKGCIMFDDLREIIGDKEFFKYLKKYFEDNKFKNATPDCLVKAFSGHSDGMESFFAGYFEGKVVIGLNGNNVA